MTPELNAYSHAYKKYYNYIRDLMYLTSPPIPEFDEPDNMLDIEPNIITERTIKLLQKVNRKDNNINIISDPILKDYAIKAIIINEYSDLYLSKHKFDKNDMTNPIVRLDNDITRKKNYDRGMYSMSIPELSECLKEIKNYKND